METMLGQSRRGVNPRSGQVTVQTQPPLAEQETNQTSAPHPPVFLDKAECVRSFSAKLKDDREIRITGLAIDKEHMFVVDRGNNRTKVFTHEGQFKFDIKVNKPYDVAVSQTGHLYITSLGYRPCVQVYSTRGQQVTTMGQGLLEFPLGITLNRQGHVMVCDREKMSIFTFHADSGQLLNTIPLSMCRHPEYITVNSVNDNIVISDWGDCVHVLSSTGDHLYQCDGSREGSGLRLPYGVCTDSYGHIFIADRYNHSVVALSPQGQFIRYIVTEDDGLKSPWAVVINPAGQLVVVEWLGNVKTFTYIELKQGNEQSSVSEEKGMPGLPSPTPMKASASKQLDRYGMVERKSQSESVTALKKTPVPALDIPLKLPHSPGKTYTAGLEAMLGQVTVKSQPSLPGSGTTPRSIVHSPVFLEKAECVHSFDPKLENDGWYITRLAIDTEQMFVVDCRNNKTKVFTHEGQFKFDIKVNEPCDVAVSQTGHLYITSGGDKCVQVFSTRGQQVTTMGQGQLEDPYGVTLNKKGHLMVCDKGHKSIFTFHADSGQLLNTIPLSMCEYPEYIKVNRANENIVVSDRFGDCVLMLSPYGDHLYQYGGTYGIDVGELSSPCGVCTDSYGHIFIADWGNNRIVALSPQGQLIKCIVTEDDGLKSPIAVVINPAGQLVVAEAGGRVKTFQYIQLNGDAIEKACEEFPHSPGIVTVFPAYKANEQYPPIIAVLVRFPFRGHKMTEYEGFSVNYYSWDMPDMEAQKALFSQEAEENPIPPEKSVEIGKVIQHESEELFNNHKNLTIISASPVKVTRGEITCTPCIVLFCRAKGVVPLGNSLFPKSIQGIPVDVREGYALLSMNRSQPHNPREVHFGQNPGFYSNPLKMGCGIGPRSSNLSGTLGMFVQHEGSTCFLTCSHVLGIPPPAIGTEVCQPSDVDQETNYYYQQASETTNSSSNARVCGVVRKYMFGNFDNEDKQYGIDAALVEVKNRRIHGIPAGLVPQTMQDLVLTQNELDFKNACLGSIEDLSPRTGLMYKCGRQTGLTQGIVRFKDGVACRPDTVQYETGQTGAPVHFQERLLSMVEICGLRTGNNDRFAVCGDSGAAVFYLKDGKPHIVGMVVAKTSYSAALISPIWPIFKLLNIELARIEEDMET